LIDIAPPPPTPHPPPESLFHLWKKPRVGKKNFVSARVSRSISISFYFGKHIVTQKARILNKKEVTYLSDLCVEAFWF
jgi:hypothetical protein